MGFSQCSSDDWRNVMLQEMNRELAYHPNTRLLYRQANGNTALQIAQVQDLLKSGIDLLIISPNEAVPLTAVVAEAFKKKLPVIVVDRKIDAPYYTAYVGGDNYEVGRMAGEYAAHLLKGKGDILELTGLPRSSPAIERHKGFADALKAYPQMHIQKQINGEWLKEKAQEKLIKTIGTETRPTLVFAHNDRMAMATYEAYREKGLPVPHIIGVDGLPGVNAGMDLVAKKAITATMMYPTGGEKAIRTAMDILQKRNYSKQSLISTTVIDSTNVRYMQLQTETTLSQQKAIERQQGMLANLKAIYNNQRTFVYILALSLVLTIVLAALAFYSLRENRKINRQLQLQNEEILSQKEQLELMSARAQEANEAKVDFFTNISHEFRTPLTLILGPLEELLANPKLGHATAQSLEMVQKNVFRLLRLVNQLMDFRKIEAGKMKIKVAEQDLVAFINEMLQHFKPVAKKRGIDLRLLTTERHLLMYFDADMLDKVMFNLLSNAFKFTTDGGLIHVALSKSENNELALIKVEDNGMGMSATAQEHLFEVFYQGEYENNKGSGLGLALSRALIEQHKGTIKVQSIKGKGTTFSISLPLEGAHQQIQASPAIPVQEALYAEDQLYTAELQDKALSLADSHDIEVKEQTILVVEDNSDLRRLLVEKLSNEYNVVEAADGPSALQQAFDLIPDLIICDVVIPGKDGREVTQLLKNDIRTSHIPVILLTAKASTEQQLAGMKTGADAYITKPFNLQFLAASARSILANRVRIRDHFTSGLTADLKTNAMSKLDRKFVNDLTALIASNISNEAFGVEEVCQEMGISRVQCNRKAKALLNLTISDFILNTRLQRAKYLLQHEEYTVGEIAYQVGFASPAYFSTVFKSKFGTTPKAFREK
nr:substrate-binding domain-containing protein [Cnuella takakiae]